LKYALARAAPGTAVWSGVGSDGMKPACHTSPRNVWRGNARPGKWRRDKACRASTHCDHSWMEPYPLCTNERSSKNLRSSRRDNEREQQLSARSSCADWCVVARRQHALNRSIVAALCYAWRADGRDEPNQHACTIEQARRYRSHWCGSTEPRFTQIQRYMLSSMRL